MLETINSNYKLQVWSGNAINNEKVGVIRHREMKGSFGDGNQINLNLSDM
jgi:hypothetical protein